jgi:V/A-type H+-transporting ATPase subunit C
MNNMRTGEKEKIKLKRKGYPYTFARVSVLRSKLLKKAEYHKLLKMEAGSIIKYLEESSYKEAIDAQALNYKGFDLIEQSLNKDLVFTFAKLRRISPSEVNFLIDTYAGRWDMHNVKTILRGIYSKAEKTYLQSLLIPAGTLNMEQLDQMLKKNTIEEALKSCKIFNYEDVKSAVVTFNETGRLIEIENRLDQIYYTKSLYIAGRIGKEGLLFKEFLFMEIDLINIRNLLRMKREGLDKKNILRHLILLGEEFSKKKLETFAATDNITTLIELLKKTEYKEAFSTNTPESFIDIELELDKLLIKKSFLFTHQHPMSVMAILSFMMGKATEVKNLKKLAKAKQLGLEEKFIEEKLIVV